MSGLPNDGALDRRKAVDVLPRVLVAMETFMLSGGHQKTRLRYAFEGLLVFREDDFPTSARAVFVELHRRLTKRAPPTTASHLGRLEWTTHTMKGAESRAATKLFAGLLAAVFWALTVR